MRKMKKVMSIVLSVAMLLTMFTFGSVPTYALTDQTEVTVNVYYGDDSVISHTWTYDDENVTLVDSEGEEAPFVGHDPIWYSMKDGLTYRLACSKDHIIANSLLEYYGIDEASLREMRIGNYNNDYSTDLEDGTFFPSYSFNGTINSSYSWQEPVEAPLVISLNCASQRHTMYDSLLGDESDEDPLADAKESLLGSTSKNFAVYLGQTSDGGFPVGNMYSDSTGVINLYTDLDNPTEECTHENTVTSYESNSDGTHTVTVTCEDCDEIISETTENCTYEDGICTLCGAEEPTIPSGDYTITAAAMASTGQSESSGTVSLSVSEAGQGEEVTVSAVPSNGYYLAQVRYSTDGESYINATLTGSEGSYDGAVFEMPAGDVSVIADFVSVVWDGSLDFTWYDEYDPKESYNMYYPSQWEALAWIASEDLEFLTDDSADASAVSAAGYQHAYQYNTNGNVPALYGEIPTRVDLSESGKSGQNYFSGVNFNIMNDMDFGGEGVNYYETTTLTTLTTEDYASHMSGPNYYPVGSQVRNDGVYKASRDSTNHFWGIFCGSVDGQGHLMDNILCDRGDASNIGGASGGSNYYQSGALIGRLGYPDATSTDYDAYANNDIVVKDIAVDGFIYCERSVGGIIGKTLHVGTGKTVTVENCINMATIWSTQSKGSGGIIGASWNQPIVNNCVNFGRCINGYSKGCGGVTGTAEGTFNNCYNVGMVSLKSGTPAYFGSQKSGAHAYNSYFLVGSTFSGAGFYSTPETPYGYFGNWTSAPQQINSLAEAQGQAFLLMMNTEGRSWATVGSAPTVLKPTYSLKSSTLGEALTSKVLMYGYDGSVVSTQTGVATLPIPGAFIDDVVEVTSIVKTSDPTTVSYEEGQTFSDEGLVITANWSNGTTETVNDYTISKTTALESSDTEIVISGTYSGTSFSFTIPITVTTSGDYTITAAAIASTGESESSGTVSLSASKADEGDEVTVSAVPSSGYYLAQVRYSTDGESYTNADLTGSEGSYNGAVFEMPAGDVSVIADFVSVVWDGSLDFTWYDENQLKDSYNMYYPSQWEALAWIASEDLYFLTDASADAATVSAAGYQHAYQYNTNGNVPALYGEIPTRTDLNKSAVSGQNYFSGVDFNIMNDMDFGGEGLNYYEKTTLTTLTTEDYASHMSGPNYYPVGSQVRNDGVYKASSDSTNHFWGIFSGSVYGQGHLMDNILCDRGDASNIGGATGGSNYYQSGALIGRLGHPDGTSTEYNTYANNDIVVKDIAVDGFIYTERSVGGIIGKTLHVGTGKTVTVENCINMATIWSTQSKGSGGIIGASWNKPIVNNCVNFGRCINGYSNGCGGVTGTAEGTYNNCYNVGMVSLKSGTPASFGSQNSGANAYNSYFLVGSTFSGAGLYSTPETPYGYFGNWTSAPQQIDSLTDAKSEAFLTAINNGGRDWVTVGSTSTTLNSSYSLKSGTLGAALTSKVLMYRYVGSIVSSQVGVASLPIPRAFINDSAEVTSIVKTSDPTTVSYVQGQTFSDEGLVLTANWNDGTTETVSDYTISKTTALEPSDTEIVISGTYSGIPFSYNIPITVVQNELSSISVTKQPTNLLYATDELFNPDGMVVTANYSNGTTRVLTAEDWSYEENRETGVVTVSHTDLGATKTAEVQISILDSAAPSSENGVYQIATANDMRWFANRVNTSVESDADAVLTNDIDLTGLDNVHIGTTKTISYSGEFDGDGHNVTLDLDASASCFGLFGSASGAYIHDVNVSGTVTSTSIYAAGIVGIATGNTTIENCSNYATITGSNYVGGIVGSSDSGSLTIRNCMNYGKITSTSSSSAYAGGIAGYIIPSSASSAVIENCGNEADIAVAGQYAGGIVGYIKDASTADFDISKCYNTGEVKCTGSGTYSRYIGGIVGYVYVSYSQSELSYLYNTGNISAGKQVGGICGYMYSKSGNYYISLYHTYGTGTVTSTANDTAYTGSLVGQSNTYVEINNGYYLTGSQPKGTSATGDITIYEKTMAEMTASGFAASLRNNFKDATCGTPLLAFQSDDTSHSFTYESNGDGTHTGTCSVCGETVTEDCTFEDGVCTKCGATQGFDVTLNNSDADGIAVTGISTGKYSGSVTFTVASDNACVVFTGTGDDLQVISSESVDESGAHVYSINVDAAKTVSIYYKGDADCNGELSVSDANAVISHCKGNTELSPMAQILGDVDGSQGIGMMDVDKLIKAVYGVAALAW